MLGPEPTNGLELRLSAIPVQLADVRVRCDVLLLVLLVLTVSHLRLLHVTQLFIAGVAQGRLACLVNLFKSSPLALALS